MNQIKKKGVSLLLTCGMMLGVTSGALAAVSEDTLTSALNDTARYMYETVKDPIVGSVGGEWAVLSLARSGYEVPDTYYQGYLSTLEDYVKEAKGVLHTKKYTEYSRVIVALSSIGKDARDVAGYDLVKPLGDYEKTIWQGMNGPIWALIALDSRSYPMPVNTEATTQATRQMYVDRILDCQLPDGGWSLTGGTTSSSANETSDPDITGMALQALAKYQDQAEVKKATEEALACMSKRQNDDGGFGSEMSGSAASSESTVQMLVGLCEMGVSLDDPRFVKNGNTLLDDLMSYYKPGKGFEHVRDYGVNQMATEQSLYALDAAQRAAQGKNSLYRMGDAITVSGVTDVPQAGQGLAAKNPDVKFMPVVEPGKTFPDVAGHANQAAIEDLASRGIINGMGADSFAPDANMTRAQFAAIVVRGLGLPEKSGNVFSDVPADKWYAKVIGTANAYGIINGKGNNLFDPEGLITRQEAAAMVTRAAKLCGMETEMNKMAVRDALAAFGDYVKTAEWSRPYLAFCYANEILDSSVLNINAGEQVHRCEIAQMLYNVLGLAKLR